MVIRDAGAATSAAARQLLERIIVGGPASRRELGRATGMSDPTVTRMTRDLVDRGFLVETHAAAAGRGRPRAPLDLNADSAPWAVGIKITADTFHGVITDLRSRPVVHRAEPVRSTAPEAVVQGVADLAHRLFQFADAHGRNTVGLGITLGAPVRDHRVAQPTPFLAWDHPVDIISALPDLGSPVTVDNDLRGLLHEVHWFGPARGASTFVLMTIGAGAALVPMVDGRAVQGSHGLAGLTELLPVPHGSHGVVPFRDIVRMQLRGDITPEHVTLACASAAAAALALIDAPLLVIGGEGSGVLARDSARFRSLVDARIAPAQREDLRIEYLDEGFGVWAQGAASLAIRKMLHS